MIGVLKKRGRRKGGWHRERGVAKKAVRRPPLTPAQIDYLARRYTHYD